MIHSFKKKRIWSEKMPSGFKRYAAVVISKDGYKSSMASPSPLSRGKLMASPSPSHSVKLMASPSHSTKSDGKSKSFDGKSKYCTSQSTKL